MPMPALNGHSPSKQEDRERLFDAFGSLSSPALASESIRRDYDKEIEWEEWILGMGGLRKRLCSQAAGNCLEVASGTGRNLEHYDPRQFSTLILSERSRSMLETALIKYRALRDKFISSRVEFKVLDGKNLPFPDNSFDTVVQSFGICSIHDPASALKEMSRVVRNDGQILLLEHGRSHYDWLNTALDKTAASHSQKWGCYYNRDILAICKESGLIVENVERFHLGTTYLLKCRRPPNNM